MFSGRVSRPCLPSTVPSPLARESSKLLLQLFRLPWPHSRPGSPCPLGLGTASSSWSQRGQKNVRNCHLPALGCLQAPTAGLVPASWEHQSPGTGSPPLLVPQVQELPFRASEETVRLCLICFCQACSRGCPLCTHSLRTAEAAPTHHPWVDRSISYLLEAWALRLTHLSSPTSD